MKKHSIVVLVAAVALCLSSCMTVKMVAPADKSVEIATEYEVLETKRQIVNWYFLLGSVPVSKHTKTDKIIAEMNLEKVRVTTKVGIGNYFLNALLNALIPTTLVTSTTIIEGNVRKPGTTTGSN